MIMMMRLGRFGMERCPVEAGCQKCQSVHAEMDYALRITCVRPHGTITRSTGSTLLISQLHTSYITHPTYMMLSSKLLLEFYLVSLQS